MSFASSLVGAAVGAKLPRQVPSRSHAVGQYLPTPGEYSEEAAHRFPVAVPLRPQHWLTSPSWETRSPPQ